MDDDYQGSVFINCPFDADYLPLLRALLFVLIRLDFKPHMALQRFDSGERRVSPRSWS